MTFQSLFDIFPLFCVLLISKGDRQKGIDFISSSTVAIVYRSYYYSILSLQYRCTSDTSNSLLI